MKQLALNMTSFRSYVRDNFLLCTFPKNKGKIFAVPQNNLKEALHGDSVAPPAFSNLALDRGEYSASSSSCFTSENRNPAFVKIGGFVDSRTGTDVIAWRKNSGPTVKCASTI